MKRTLLSLLTAYLLAACQPSLTPVALPTPTVLEVQVTPALTHLGQSFNDCANELENSGLVVLETPAALLDLNRSALALRWGPGYSGADQPGYAAVIGQEELAVIVHPDNPLNSISRADLQALYSGALRSWPQTDPAIEVQPWVYPDGDDVLAVFQSALLDGSAPSPRAVYNAPDPAAVLEAVAENPGAVGFLPARRVNSSVKALVLEGIDPAQLRQPILAWSNVEPKGPEKAWLICLQERLSE